MDLGNLSRNLGKASHLGFQDSTNNDKLDNDSKELYDRQIRLWGLDVQEKISTCRVLVIGCDFLGQELIKNLLLGGVNHLGLVDDRVITKDTSELFIRPEDAYKKRSFVVANSAVELNSRAKINHYSHIDYWNESTLQLLISSYDVIVYLYKMVPVALDKLRHICSTHFKPFIYGGHLQDYGFALNIYQNQSDEHFPLDFRHIIDSQGFKSNLQNVPTTIMDSLLLYNRTIELNSCSQNPKSEFCDFLKDAKLEQLHDYFTCLKTPIEKITVPKISISECSIACIVAAHISENIFSYISDPAGFDSKANEYFHYDFDQNLASVIKL